MVGEPAPGSDDATGPGRRALLGGGLAAAGVAATAFGAGRLTAAPRPGRAPDPAAPAASGTPVADGSIGEARVPWSGDHQAGVLTPPQAQLVLIGMDLAAEATRDSARRLLRIWSSDIGRLAEGRGTLADTEPELAVHPASLTVTLGLGPRFFEITGTQDQRPAWLKPVPALPAIDRLDPAWGQTDLVVQVCCDDPTTASHAVRVLVKDARGLATVRWQQRGFRRSAGTAPGETLRNLLGQVDGTRNPPEQDVPELVWAGSDAGWMAGGTGMVVRRIRMLLETWEAADRPERDRIMGRRMSDGAPLTGQNERDEPDLDAVDENGVPVIARGAHIRRARDDDAMHRFLRRPYSYDDAPPAGAIENAGLVFIAFAADLERQFVPIQQRLAENDLLNTWTTPIGSAVYAVPPGFRPGGYVGEGLLG